MTPPWEALVHCAQPGATWGDAHPAPGQILPSPAASIPSDHSPSVSPCRQQLPPQLCPTALGAGPIQWGGSRSPRPAANSRAEQLSPAGRAAVSRGTARGVRERSGLF